MDIWQSLNGWNWEIKWNINHNDTSFGNSSHCGWYGVLCDNTTNHILAINMARNNLQGNLYVPRLKNLHFLLGLCLEINAINGDLEKILVNMPKYVLRLSLAYNQIHGSIPENIVSVVPILSKLQLSGNPVGGKIPESLGDLVDLTVLSIGETTIRGFIPQAISKLKRIWFLDLEALELEGDMSIFQNLTKLAYIHLSSNRITGNIPEDLGLRYPSLVELLLQNNNLSGTLPQSIGFLDKLVTLNVARNSLSGYVPAALSKLHLKVLVLSSNQFIGFESGQNFTFKNLNIFRASHLTKLTCCISKILSLLMPSKNELMQIDISNSNISGHLPDTVFSFQRLTFLKIASNRLSGAIPSPIANLPYLTMLDLRNNNFSGRIPVTFSRLLMLTELYLQGNKHLKGPITTSYLKLDYMFTVNERVTDTCPMVRFAHNHGEIHVDSSYYKRNYCHCKEHYFGIGGHCSPCMQGSYCPGSTKQKPFKPLSNAYNVSVSKMFLKKGFFPFPNEKGVESIRKCPTSIHIYNICVPGGSCDCQVSHSDNNSSTVNGGILRTNSSTVRCNSDCLCPAGHRGRFCSECKQGYFKNGIRCFKCPRGTTENTKHIIFICTTAVIILISIPVFWYYNKPQVNFLYAVAGFLFTIILFFYSLIPAFLIPLMCIPIYFKFKEKFKPCLTVAKTGFYFFQIVNTLVSTTSVWPKAIYRAQMRSSSASSFEFASLSCVVPALFTQWVKDLILSVLPIICLIVIWIVYWCRKKWQEPNEDDLQKIEYNHLEYSINAIDLFYFPIAFSSFSGLNSCRSIGSVSFMKSYVWVDCPSFEHHALLGIAIFDLVVFVMVPLILCIILPSRFRHEFSNTHWLDPIVSPYEEKYRCWIGFVMLLKRLLIAIIMIFIDADLPEQTLIIVVVLTMFIILQTYLKPYKNQNKSEEDSEDKDPTLCLEDAMEIAMLSSLLLTFTYVGLSVGRSWSLGLFVATIISNALFSIAVFISILYRFNWKACCGTKEVAISI